MGQHVDENEVARLMAIKAQRNVIYEIAANVNRLAREAEASATKNLSILKIVDEKVNMVSRLMVIHKLYDTTVTRDELDEARNLFYEVLIHLESIVSRTMDGPFSEYEEGLATIGDYTDEERFNLVRKIGFAIDSLMDAYRSDTKWKWSFVDMNMRLAVIAKNLLNLRTFVTEMDPRVDGYETRMMHLALAKELLTQAANNYREKYELSKTQNVNDMKVGIHLLLALRRLHVALGEADQADTIKRKAQIWQAKLNDDLKKNGK